MSKPKVILFDVDGVLIKYRHNFTDELAMMGYEDAVRIMQPYYHADNTALYNNGGRTEEELLAPYLEKLDWKGTAEDYLYAQCEFSKQHLDQDLLSQIQKLRRGGTPCYTATNQGPFQAKFLTEKLLADAFDGHFVSCHIGCKKDSASFWEFALQSLQKDMEIASAWDIAYFDDKQGNVDLALTFGIQGFLFANNIQFENDMNMLGFDLAFGRHI